MYSIVKCSHQYCRWVAVHVQESWYLLDLDRKARLFVTVKAQRKELRMSELCFAWL